jgi:peptidoglycan/xylan/chitin deacetylase (PgdA/CDA1 family)
MVSQLRSLLRHLFVYALYLSGELARAKRRIRSSNGTVVLTFHRVLPDTYRSRTLSPAGMIVSESSFSRLVSYLSTRHQITPLTASRCSNSSDRLRVIITFDDGWSDNAIYAHPILCRSNAAATIFLCPDKMGQDLPFWPERLTAFFHAATRAKRSHEFFHLVADSAFSADAALHQVIDTVKEFSPERRDALLTNLQQLLSPETATTASQIDSTMSWDVARRLSQSGIEFGSHTLHHEILTHIPIDIARTEISQSGKRVSQEIGLPCFAFAYPNGDWSLEVRNITASAGYSVAFANSPGIWGAQTDPYAVPRVNLWEGAVTGLLGRFSRPHFDYVVFWRALRANERQRSRNG